MPYFSIKVPARFCEGSNSFATLDLLMDIENDKIELVSEDRKNVIRLDVLCADGLREILQKVSNSKSFQSTLREKIVEHRGRYHAVDLSTL